MVMACRHLTEITSEASMIGYIYVMLNPAFPNLVKIGRTNRNSQERAAELYTTGTPGKFIVLYEALVDDCIAVETLLHQHFSSNRYSESREFFEIPPHLAINTIQEFCKGRLVNINTNENLKAITYPAKNSKLYLYMAFIGDINRKNHEEIDLERIGKSGKLYRIGLHERSFESPMDDDWDFDEEEDVKINLTTILREYYSKISKKDYSDSKIHFQHIFSFECNQIFISDIKVKIDQGIKEFLNQYDNFCPWISMFDEQTLSHVPNAYAEGAATSLFAHIYCNIDNEIIALKKALEENRNREEMRIIRSEFDGNF